MNRKAATVIALLLIAVIIFAGCEPIQGEPVPYDDIVELSEAVGFDVLEPASLPDGYVLSGYYCVGDAVAELLYMSGDNQIIYAMSKVKNITRDIEDYDEIVEQDINGHKAKLTLKDGYVMLGVMQIGDYSYSIYSQSGLSVGEFKLIADTFGMKPEEVEETYEEYEDVGDYEETEDEAV